MAHVNAHQEPLIRKFPMSVSALGSGIVALAFAVLTALAFKLFSSDLGVELLGVVLVVGCIAVAINYVFLTRFYRTEYQLLDDALAQEQLKNKKLEQQASRLSQDLVKSQDSLIHSEKMASLGQLSAGVAHEINNPVGFMMSNMCTLKEYMFFLDCLTKQLLELKHSLSGQEKQNHLELVDKIDGTLKLEDLRFVLEDADSLITESIDGGSRIKSITNSMKGYAHESEDEQAVDINKLIEETLTIAWNQIKYSCELEKSLEAQRPVLLAPGAFNQVLLNIMMNASHAMEDSQGLLKVSSYDTGTTVNIEIADTGCGIAEENLKKIFDPFFTTKPVGQGTGLGMSISYDIVKRFQGEIKVKSELGRGTCFTISLPALDVEND